MAKKDVDEYFAVVCNDYHEAINTLHDVEEFAQQNIMSPEKLDEIKSEVEGIKNNYLRISYIMYLLNKPKNNKNKRKQKVYEDTNKYDTKCNLDYIMNEDKEAIDRIKERIKG